VIDAVAEVLAYALAAAASALVLSATFLVVRSERPRVNGIAFLTGFVVGTLLACGLGLGLGQAVVDRLDSHDTLKAAVTLVFGIVLLVIGFRARHAPPSPEARSTRATAIFAGLRTVGPAASASMAGLLGFGGPKRLLLTFLAMATVTEAGLREIVDVTLVAIYVVVSTLLVSVPVCIVIVAGHRADVILVRAQTWLSEHAGALRVWLSLGIGGVLVIDGLLRLA
jgi:hypothetical protein